MVQNTVSEYANRLARYLRVLLGALIGMFITGTAMTAIGQPTTSHVLSTNSNRLWHVLLVFHLLFLAALTISAIGVLYTTFTKVQHLKRRASLGMLVVVCGIVSGNLVLHKIHPAIFLFCMALSFLLIGFIYGPLAGHRGLER
jgi:Na+/melibiose symporter-like transporter